MSTRHALNLPLVLILCCLLLPAGCGKQEPGTQSGILRIGTDATYPPFETVNTETANPEGFDIDLITEVCRINGWKPEFVVTPFDGMIPGLQSKKYDVAISAMTITPERQGVIDFSDPYYLAGQTIAVPLADGVIRVPDDLKGKRVGVQLGTTGELMAQKIDGAKVFSYDNIGAAFIDMQNGNLDAVLNDYPTTQAYIRAHKTAKMVGDILSKENYGIALRKGDTELCAAINKALAEIRTSGKYRELHLKWFDTEPPPDK
jgi:ABC-type amino acid transport substrate-binding protein